MQKHLDKHFKSEGYTEFFHVTLIDKIDGSNPTKRERERVTGCEPLKYLQLTALIL